MFRPRQVDFTRSLSRVGQHHHFGRGHFNEAAEDDDRFLGVALFDPHLARGKRADQRSVLRKDSEEPIGSGHHDHVNIGFRIHRALAGHHFDFELRHRYLRGRTAS